MHRKTEFKDLPAKLESPDASIQYKSAEEGVSGTYFVVIDDAHLAVFKDSAQDPLCSDNKKLQPQIMQFGLNF